VWFGGPGISRFTAFFPTLAYTPTYCKRAISTS
jgi:hypothetical protein